MIEVPVFVINGFLESGKTTLIKEIIESNSSVQKLDTLIVSCEDGIEEYDEKFLKENRCILVSVEDESELTPKFFTDLDNKYEPARVVVEYNSFYKFSSLNLPDIYVIGQVITLIDTQSFKLYYDNMRQIMNEICKESDLIIFNRIEGKENELGNYRRLIRAFNKDGQVAFEGKDGALTDTLEEDLPYDLSKDFIDLKEADYPTFYMDCFDNYERYYNKKISFIAMLEELEDVDDKSSFLPGRKVMTCCAQDIRFLGFETRNDIKMDFKAGDWAKITVTVAHEFSNIEGHDAVILHLVDFVKIKPLPDDDVLSIV